MHTAKICGEPEYVPKWGGEPEDVLTVVLCTKLSWFSLDCLARHPDCHLPDLSFLKRAMLPHLEASLSFFHTVSSKSLFTSVWLSARQGFPNLPTFCRARLAPVALHCVRPSLLTCATVSVSIILLSPVAPVSEMTQYQAVSSPSFIHPRATVLGGCVSACADPVPFCHLCTFIVEAVPFAFCMPLDLPILLLGAPVLIPVETHLEVTQPCDVAAGGHRRKCITLVPLAAGPMRVFLPGPKLSLM